MTEAQREILKNLLEQEGEMYEIEQISYLKGGNISADSLTVVTVQTIENDGTYRFTDAYGPDGHTDYSNSAKLSDGAYRQTPRPAERAEADRLLAGRVNFDPARGV